MKRKGPFTQVSSFLLDLLFPRQCLGCRKPGAVLCIRCQATIPHHTEQYCPVCKKHITPNGKVCLDCSGQTPLDGLLAAAPYRNKILKRAIHFYKYRSIEELLQPLGTLLLQHIQNSTVPLPDVVIPVPLHVRRLRLRGFNQSEHLAHFLSQHLTPVFPLPVLSDSLRRIRYTTPQMNIRDAQERRSNIQGAFSWQPPQDTPADIAHKRIWLIDDVATTTATLSECASVLKKDAGVKEVFAVVLAR
jgi:ComF family protein